MPTRAPGSAERRRDLLYRLTQKYGPTIAEVLDTGAKAAAELDLLDTADVTWRRYASAGLNRSRL